MLVESVPNVSEGRDETVLADLRANGIGADVYYPEPVHQLRHVTDVVPAVTLPNTEDAAASILSLPMHPGLTDEEVRTVVDAMWAAVERHVAQPAASDGSAA